MNLRVLPEANGDITEVLAWLVERRRYRVIRGLWAAWETALEQIAAQPRRFPPAEDAPPGMEVRDYPILRYGYRIVYLLTDTEIRVFSFLGNRRSSTHWLSRLQTDDNPLGS